jgi:GNAT superfamily N-acetyltransferase
LGTTKIEIRPYEEADFDAVTRIWFESWESTQIHLPNPALHAELRERLPNEIAGGWSVYVGTAGARISGFIALQEDTLLQLFVAPNLQGCGVGKQLLDFVKMSRPAGFWLTTPTEGRAVRFYEREGLRRGDTATHPRFGHEIVRYSWLP